LNTARDLLRLLPSGPERDRKDLGLEITTGAALISTRGWGAPDAGQAYSRAVELSRRVGNSSQSFQALAGLFDFCEVHGELYRARDVAAELAHEAERTQDATWMCNAHYPLGDILFWLGEFEQALSHLDRAISRHAPGQTDFRFGADDSRITCREYAAWVLWHLGYPDRALTRSREALGLGQHLHHPSGALMFGALLHHLRREGDLVLEHTEKLIELSGKHGFQFLLLNGSLIQGWARAEEGQVSEGVEQLCRSLEAFRAGGAELLLPWYLAMLAEACVKAGRTEEASVALTEALATAARTGERHNEAELHRLSGELLVERVRSDSSAEQCFRTAIEIARQQKAKSWELRATMSLARLLAKQDRRDEARAMLADIYGWFTEGFDTADLKDAKALLDQLNA
jgi:predicted ATPase